MLPLGIWTLQTFLMFLFVMVVIEKNMKLVKSCLSLRFIKEGFIKEIVGF